MVLDLHANLPVVMVATLPIEPLSALLVLNLTESDIWFEVARFRDASQYVASHSTLCSLAEAKRQTCMLPIEDRLLQSFSRTSLVFLGQ